MILPVNMTSASNFIPPAAADTIIGFRNKSLSVFAAAETAVRYSTVSLRAIGIFAAHS